MVKFKKPEVECRAWCWSEFYCGLWDLVGGRQA